MMRRLTGEAMDNAANPNFRPDVSLALRRLVRTLAVAAFAICLMHGMTATGGLQEAGAPLRNWQGKLAGFVGLSAERIQITGLQNQAPDQVLAAIGVKPGGSLVGFDAQAARRKLASLDWVESASVERIFPNELAISLTERQAFAIWQNEGSFSVIDKSGAVMGGLSASSFPGLPLVTGEGANLAVADLVNQLEATPALKAKVRASARVGQRRWTLYLDNGVKVVLPEGSIAQALAKAAELDQTQALLSKGITQLDLRQPDEVVIALAMVVETPAATGKPGQGH